MRRGKYRHALKYFSIAVVTAAVAVFLFLHKKTADSPLQPIEQQKAEAQQQAEKKTTGYKEEDRRKLEQLIHEGSKDD